MASRTTGRRSGPRPAQAGHNDASPAPGHAALPARVPAGDIELAALDAELAYVGPERRANPAAGLAKLLASVLDEVDYGLLMLSADGVVVHANQAARTELASAGSLRLVGRRLAGRSGAEQASLDKAMAAARGDGRRTMLTIAGADGGRLGLSIVPLPAALTRSLTGHAVLVSFERSRIAGTLAVDAHAREHGLTLREQQVLAALCDGLRAKEIARRLGIGEATVRTHVNNIKAKTGCASIVDIVNKVSRLPPIAVALRPDGGRA